MHLIGSTEAAQLLGIDKSTLTRWVQAGRLTVVVRASGKPNSAMLFERAAVEAVAAETGAAVAS